MTINSIIWYFGKEALKVICLEIVWCIIALVHIIPEKSGWTADFWW